MTCNKSTSDKKRGQVVGATATSVTSRPYIKETRTRRFHDAALTWKQCGKRVAPSPRQRGNNTTIHTVDRASRNQSHNVHTCHLKKKKVEAPPPRELIGPRRSQRGRCQAWKGGLSFRPQRTRTQGGGSSYFFFFR